MSSAHRWSLEEDAYLWAHRGRDASALASHFSQPLDTIHARFLFLTHPSNSAHMRLVEGSQGALGTPPPSGTKRSRPEENPGGGGGGGEAPLKGLEEGLFSSLVELRRALATRGNGGQGVPAHTLTTDAVLREMCRVRPTDLEELRAITGLDEKVVASYGAHFLGVILASSSSSSSSSSSPPSPSGPALQTSVFHVVSVGSGSSASSSSASAAAAAATATAASAAAASPSASSASEPKDESTLNAEQKATYVRAFSGGNFFLTGAAGTGKSYLLKVIIAALESRYPGGGVAVTAPTGIAASLIDGVTLHSWAGIGLGKGSPEDLLGTVMGSRAAQNRWREAKVLVIDEVSMLDSTLFSALDLIGRIIRKVEVPFGGLQVITCGDFYQLPPVSLEHTGFAFQSSAWAASGMATCNLTKVVRQAGDAPFLALLNEVRVGKCSAHTTAVLAACHVSRKPQIKDGIEATRLYCTNKDVDFENMGRLNALPGGEEVFHAGNEWKIPPPHAAAERAFTEAMDKKVPPALRLKKGAQVLLTRNWAGKGLVNGSRGVVEGFAPVLVTGSFYHGVLKMSYPGVIVRFTSGLVETIGPVKSFLGTRDAKGARLQIPLKLAWALTIHRSQGMTLDRAELQLENAFAPGQVYVALSRVTSLHGLWVNGGAITQAAIKAHTRVLNFYGEG